MFSIFNKKYFIADYLEGLTDIHCHLLPAIDDGSKSDEMSIEMVHLFEDLGYDGVVATPHIMEGYYDNDTNQIKNTQAHLKKVLHAEGLGHFQLNAAAEYMLDKEFDELLKIQDLLPVYKQRVLVEMSYLQQAIFVDSQLFTLQQQGFIPILAHPERYVYLKDTKEVLAFKKQGCYLQLNALSLTNHYGSHAHKQAMNLLMADHYDFLGTDAHGPRHLKQIKEIQLGKKQIAHFEKLVGRTKENLGIPSCA